MKKWIMKKVKRNKRLYLLKSRVQKKESLRMKMKSNKKKLNKLTQTHLKKVKMLKMRNQMKIMNFQKLMSTKWYKMKASYKKDKTKNVAASAKELKGI